MAEGTPGTGHPHPPPRAERAGGADLGLGAWPEPSAGQAGGEGFWAESPAPRPSPEVRNSTCSGREADVWEKVNGSKAKANSAAPATCHAGFHSLCLSCLAPLPLPHAASPLPQGLGPAELRRWAMGSHHFL